LQERNLEILRRPIRRRKTKTKQNKNYGNQNVKLKLLLRLSTAERTKNEIFATQVD